MAGKFINQTSVICMCQKQLIGISNAPINIARIVILGVWVGFCDIQNRVLMDVYDESKVFKIWY